MLIAGAEEAFLRQKAYAISYYVKKRRSDFCPAGSAFDFASDQRASQPPSTGMIAPCM
jgi:hypothetical protein